MFDFRPALIIFILWVCFGAIADTLVLINGDTLVGQVSGENSATVTIDTASGRFTLNRSKIKIVTKESPVENQKRLLEQYISEGKLDAALHIYRDEELQKALPSRAFDQLMVQHLKIAANAASATSETAVFMVRRAVDDPSTPAELQLLAASLSLRYDNQTSVTTLLRRVSNQQPQMLEWSPAIVSSLLDQIASAGLQSQNGEIVALTAELATRLPSKSDTVTNQLALYSTIEGHVRKNRFLEASSLFRPELFLHRADLFIPLAERLTLAILAAPANESNLAAMQSAATTVLPYVDPNMRMRSLKYLVNRLMDTNRLPQAQDLADTLSQKDPDSGAILQHLIEFRRRRAQLDSSVPLAQYKLAAWARSMGLSDEARAVFIELRPDPRFTETVNIQLNLINNAQAKVSYSRLKTLYDKNQYDRLQTEANEFLRTNPPEKFADDTKALLQLVDFENWSKTRTSQGQAEAEFQHAERLSQRGNYDEALAQLNRIQLDRHNTAASQKTQALRDKIMREKLKEAAKKTQPYSSSTTPGSVP